MRGRLLLPARGLKGGSLSELPPAAYLARECARLQGTVGNVSSGGSALPAGGRAPEASGQPAGGDAKAARGEAGAQRGDLAAAASPRASPSLEVVPAGATRRGHLCRRGFERPSLARGLGTGPVFQGRMHKESWA